MPLAFVNHYKKNLGTKGDSRPNIPHYIFHRKVTLEQAQDMIRTVTDAKIKTAMFGISDDKAPGPDGHTAAFFKASWDIVQHDVCLTVREFFQTGQLLKQVKNNIISLILKVETLKKVNEYRPDILMQYNNNNNNSQSHWCEVWGDILLQCYVQMYK